MAKTDKKDEDPVIRAVLVEWVKVKNKPSEVRVKFVGGDWNRAKLDVAYNHILKGLRKYKKNLLERKMEEKTNGERE